jgi:hypothetical protein
MIISANLFRSDELLGWASVNSTEGVCEISGKEENLIDTLQLADFFLTLFSLFEADANGRPLVDIIQQDWKLCVEDEIAKVILPTLILETGFLLAANEKVNYKRDVLEPCIRWTDIKKALRTERRFFAGELIQDDDQWDVFFASNFTIKTNTLFKRARINEDEKRLYTEEKDLGMPPADKATSGRANTYGIPYLYLGTDDDTVMYESRALKKDILSVASFKTTTDLDVVDFTFKPDLFAFYQQSKEEFLLVIQRYVFLDVVSGDLSKAVRRYDDKEIDYLPTQFVCEYIRLVTAAKGLIFQSAQYPKGKNIVLFDDKNVRFEGVVHREVGTVEMAYA